MISNNIYNINVDLKLSIFDINIEDSEFINWAFILCNGIIFNRRFITESKYLGVNKYSSYYLTRDLA